MPLWKRIIDIAVSLAAMPVLAACALPVLACHGLVSPGPLFYSQERVGRRGRTFRIYKFRTMMVDADTSVHAAYFSRLIHSHDPMTKMDCRGDSRLFPGSRLLRASGFDELPQLINVLRGDMSLVGPRPCLPSEYAEYLPEQRLRLDVVPGLTGLWQVSGKNRTTFEEMIRLDIEYRRNLSPRLDAWILMKTIPAVLMEIRDAQHMGAPTDRPHDTLAALRPGTGNRPGTISPN